MKQDFNLWLYLAVLIFVGVSIAINYAYDLEDQFEQQYKGTFIIYPLYFLIYAIPYYFTCWLTRLFTKAQVFSSPQFWLKSFFALALMTIDKCFYFHNAVFYNSDPAVQMYWFRVIGNGRSLLTVFLPLLAFYFLSKDRTEKNFYGINSKSFDVKPYLVLLLIMAPIIYLASTTEGFLETYPRANDIKADRAAAYFNQPKWLIISSFEVVYSWDFIMVELLIRGFLIVGMIKVLGRHAILPMAVVYCFYHLGKPIGETYSSILGGYILGILAYYSRSIWGGVLIHLGVALLMELFAWIQLTLR